MLFDRFSMASRKAIFCARAEASLAGSKVIDTQHVLVGLIRVDPGTLQLIAQRITLNSVRETAILMPDRASELKLKPTTTAQVAGLGRGQDETAHLLSGVRLAWGYDKRLRLDDQRIAALRIDYISRQTGHRVDGILGASGFSTSKFASITNMVR